MAGCGTIPHGGTGIVILHDQHLYRLGQKNQVTGWVIVGTLLANRPSQLFGLWAEMDVGQLGEDPERLGGYNSSITCKHQVRYAIGWSKERTTLRHGIGGATEQGFGVWSGGDNPSPVDDILRRRVLIVIQVDGQDKGVLSPSKGLEASILHNQLCACVRH